MHQIYNNIFNKIPAMDVKLIVGHWNNRTTKLELNRNRPDKRLLKNHTIKSKQNTHTNMTTKSQDTENTSLFIFQMQNETNKKNILHNQTYILPKQLLQHCKINEKQYFTSSSFLKSSSKETTNFLFFFNYLLLFTDPHHNLFATPI